MHPAAIVVPRVLVFGRLCRKSPRFTILVNGYNSYPHKVIAGAGCKQKLDLQNKAPEEHVEDIRVKVGP